MPDQHVHVVFDAAGVVLAAYTDRGDAERLAAYFGIDPDELDGGIDQIPLDRDAAAWAIDDEHRN